MYCIYTVGYALVLLAVGNALVFFFIISPLLTRIRSVSIVTHRPLSFVDFVLRSAI